MKSKIVGTIMLGGVLGFIQPAAMAQGQCLEVKVETGSCPGSGSLPAYVCNAGSEGFREQVAEATGSVAALRSQGCVGTHIVIEPVLPGSLLYPKCPQPGESQCNQANKLEAPPEPK